MKRKRLIPLLLLPALAFTLLAAGMGSRSAEELEPLTVSILKVGKADAIVIQTGSSVMVIDAGEEEDGQEVVDFLSEQGITRVDTLIITHYDKDHVGGADTLVESLDIGQVLLPAYTGQSTEYTDFMAALEQKNITPLELTEPMEFDFGPCSVLVEPPASYETESDGEVDNNFSLITTVTHGDNRLVFAGDIEKQRIRSWLSSGDVLPCDFLKIPHHGVYNAALEELFDALSPTYAVICSSEKNPADEQTLELLGEAGTSVLETRDGDVTVISDGKTLALLQ